MTFDHPLPQPARQRGLLPKPRAQISARRIPFFDKVDLWLSSGRCIDGLWVGSIEDKPQPGLSRVEDALRLVKDCDPLNYTRVVRYLDRIWVRLISRARAEYQRQLNACALDQRYVLSETITVEKIASTIVHETTHARLERWGIAYDEKLRPRIEAICLRRELNFASKLPDGEALREEVAASLEWYASDHDFFSDTRFDERHLKGSIETLRHLGTPEWFIRIVSKVAEYRLAHRSRRSLT
jgi:hypothetical protein